MSKEPGQFLWEVVGEIVRLHDKWERAPVWTKEKYAVFESAIRADEAAKVRAATIEECAKVAEGYNERTRRYDSHEYNTGRNDAAAALRAILAKHKEQP